MSTASTLKAENGMVIGPGKGQKATYGQLAAAASKLPVPEKVALKDPSQFRIVGKRTTRLDTPAKVNGTAVFGIDVKLPGMVYASLEQCPVIGGTVKSFDASAAKAHARRDRRRADPRRRGGGRRHLLARAARRARR